MCRSIAFSYCPIGLSNCNSAIETLDLVRLKSLAIALLDFEAIANLEASLRQQSIKYTRIEIAVIESHHRNHWEPPSL